MTSRNPLRRFSDDERARRRAVCEAYSGPYKLSKADERELDGQMLNEQGWMRLAMDRLAESGRVLTVGEVVALATWLWNDDAKRQDDRRHCWTCRGEGWIDGWPTKRRCYHCTGTGRTRLGLPSMEWANSRDDVDLFSGWDLLESAVSSVRVGRKEAA